MPRIIELVPHNPDWPRQFAAAAAWLTPYFGDNLVGIEHIGSTAVPQLTAKPIIDILVLVHDIAQVAPMTNRLTAQGLVYKGENGILGRRYFRQGSDDHHSHHIHVFAADHPEVGRYLRFRDYLRAHPQRALVYTAVKRQLAQKFRHDPAAYTSGKTAVVQQLDAEAAEWVKRQRRREA